MGAGRGNRPALVVGAGLTGAALAYVLARAGRPTILVSVDRPASQATALSAGIVHGLGPPGLPQVWAEMDSTAHAAAAARSRAGYQLLQEILLSAPRSCGLVRVEHRLRPPVAAEVSWLDRAGSSLRDAGWPVELEESPSGPVLLRRDEALVNPRRLTFELLRAARATGARVLLGTPFHGIERSDAEGVTVRLGKENPVVGGVLWSAGHPPSGTALPPLRARLVLYQVLGPGRDPLGSILELGDGDLQFLPDPLHPGHSVLVRMAEESPAGGLVWPELPREWESLRGAALRQRLAEAIIGSPDRPFAAAGPLVVVTGLSNWPVTATLGACLEASGQAFLG